MVLCSTRKIGNSRGLSSLFTNMIKSNPFVNVRKYIKMQGGYGDKIDLKVLFYRTIGGLLLSKAYENFGEFGGFYKLQNFSTLDILGYSQQ